MPQRIKDDHRQTFSFVVADSGDVFTEYAMYLPAAVLEDIAVVLEEIRRVHCRPQRVKLKSAKAVLPFTKRKRSA
jgi:hypothetical protein